MAIALALAAAIGYGVGDFLGGIVSRRTHYAWVGFVAGVSSLVVTAIAAMAAGPVDVDATALLWGAFSGLGTAGGTLALFRGFSLGRMGVTAPLSALGAAAIPVLFGVLLGESPSPTTWAGIIVAMPAIWLVSSSGAEPTTTPTATSSGRLGQTGALDPGVRDGLLAGVGFSILFIGLKLAGDGSGLWPVVTDQAAALPIFAVVVLRMVDRADRTRFAMTSDVTGAALVGILGAGAAVAYFLATHAGLLSIAVVLTSLYPAVTVLLAILVTHEAIGRRQGVGLVLAALAIVLIVAP